MSSDEIVFRIAGKQYQRLVEWERSIDEKVFKQELETAHSPRGVELDEDWLMAARMAVERGQAIQPWYSSIQGVYVYRFIPTTLGIVVKVENAETGDSIDLTDYSDW
jgi:hypothetical protein